MKQKSVQFLKNNYGIELLIICCFLFLALGCFCGYILCYNLMKKPIEYMQIRFAIEILKGDTEINRFLEDKDNKLLYASSEYSRPVLTISILTEKDMIEKDKILLNNIIKSKFIHCVDHEKTLSDVQIVYLSRYDVFLPRFGAKTCPQSNDSQHKGAHRTEGKSPPVLCKSSRGQMTVHREFLKWLESFFVQTETDCRVSLKISHFPAEDSFALSIIS